MLYWRYWFSVTRKLTWIYKCRPVILCCILKTICWTNFVTGILDPCDERIYLIKCMWVSDLYFMVQLFWQSYILKTIWWINDLLEILIQCDTTYTYMFGQRPIFRGTVILNTIWWTTIILWILVQCDMGHWPIFHERFWIIFLFLPYSRGIKNKHLKAGVVKNLFQVLCIYL